MSRSVEVTAKTMDKAIEDALLQLGASYDEVNVEVLSEGGFLRKAKVLVTLKEGKKESSVALSKIEESVKEEEWSVPNVDAQKEEKKAIKKEVKKEKKVDKAEVKKVVKTESGEMPVKFVKCKEFVIDLLKELGHGDMEVTTEITEKSFNINISGEKAGIIIGKGGDVMNALQTIISSIAIAHSNGEYRRVHVNVENYKERRLETLKALALKKAEKVKATGRYVKLEPMTARDRAIIHSALQEVEGIRTYSTGKDPYRCLCIAPAKREEE